MRGGAAYAYPCARTGNGEAGQHIIVIRALWAGNDEKSLPLARVGASPLPPRRVESDI